MDWIKSSYWAWNKDIHPNESDYWTWFESVLNLYWERVKEQGLPIIRPDMNGASAIVFANDIDWNQIKADAVNNNWTFKYQDGSDWVDGWGCPFCAKDRGFIMRIICPASNPQVDKRIGRNRLFYYDGFIDRGGLPAKCLCVPVRRAERNKELKKDKKQLRDEDHY